MDYVLSDPTLYYMNIYPFDALQCLKNSALS